VTEPDLATVRQRLAAVSEPNGLTTDQRNLVALYGIADALLLLLPPGPLPDKHTVDDNAPYYGTERTPDGREWTWRWDYVRVMMDNPGDEPGDQRPIRLDTDACQWMSVGEAVGIAAELLSAAARARAAQTEGT
jgi:hypothetical protein